jgi:hypothetical protein
MAADSCGEMDNGGADRYQFCGYREKSKESFDIVSFIEVRLDETWMMFVILDIHPSIHSESLWFVVSMISFPRNAGKSSVPLHFRETFRVYNKIRLPIPRGPEESRQVPHAQPSSHAGLVVSKTPSGMTFDPKRAFVESV